MAFDRTLAKHRTFSTTYVIILLAAALGLYRYSVPLMRLFARRQEVADLGVEIFQPIIVAMIYVLSGTVFSTMMAAFITPQLKENAFGTLSRWGVTFFLSFLGFCWVAGSIL